MDEKRNKIFISYASADQEVAKRVAECLRSKNKEIWFDQIEIVWGDHIVSEINKGLSTSFMGIVILSRNFFDREMPQLELNSMVFLMNLVKFRILPLYHVMDHSDLLLRYPLLSNIRVEKADEDCDTLVSKLENAVKKARELVHRPLMHSDLVTNSDLRQSPDRATEVDQSEMENIMTELRKDTTKYQKEATITKLRHYSDTKRIWRHNATWEIISWLLDSRNDQDIINGLYVSEYMIKISEKTRPGDSSFVVDNIRERFAPQLLKLIYPGSQMRISQDSFRLLKMVIEESILSKYASEALSIAMEQITNDNEYQNYIQIYVWHFESTSKQNKKALCDTMYTLTLKEGRVAERALNLYTYFVKTL